MHLYSIKFIWKCLRNGGHFFDTKVQYRGSSVTQKVVWKGILKLYDLGSDISIQLLKTSIRITRMWNMISSPATPTVCLEQKSENFQSRKVALSMPSQYQNNCICIWDNLHFCLLVPMSPSKPVMLTFDLQSRKVLFIEIVFWHV